MLLVLPKKLLKGYSWPVQLHQIVSLCQHVLKAISTPCSRRLFLSHCVLKRTQHHCLFLLGAPPIIPDEHTPQLLTSRSTSKPLSFDQNSCPPNWELLLESSDTASAA